jgi:hypothetical protein
MQPHLPPPTVERRADQTFVDSILMEAGQYKGFAYLTADKAAPGKSFGVEFPEGGGSHSFVTTPVSSSFRSDRHVRTSGLAGWLRNITLPRYPAATAKLSRKSFRNRGR